MRKFDSVMLSFQIEADTMKMELNLSIPYLQARVDNSDPLWFLFDTGAQITLIDKEVALGLGLKTEGSVQGGGGGEELIEISFVNNITIALADLSTSIAMAAVAPIRHLLESYTGRRVHGVLGYDFISQYVIELDYADANIHLHDPSQYRYSGKGEIIPLSIESNHPHIRAALSDRSIEALEADFVVDTGASLALSMATAFVDDHGFIKSGAATHQTFVVGVGGVAKTPVGRIDNLRVGSFVIDRPVTYFSQDKGGAFAGLLGADGVIGAQFLRRFTVIFDYQNERMILEPNRHFNEPDESDADSLSGILITVEGHDLKTFRVVAIIEDSPAAMAGVKEGDIILAVNGKPAEGFDLERLRKEFVSGKFFRVTVERDAEHIDLVMNTTYSV